MHTGASTKMILVLLAAVAVGCGGTKGTPWTGPDGETDVPVDSTGDSMTDVMEDTVADTAADPATDTDLDTSEDTFTDTSTDTSPDTATDPIPDPLPDGTDVTDTDGDTIRDADEGAGAVDTDGDTVPDTDDLDSDGDGIPDSMEAGDDDPLTPPVDSDFDGTPDFRDEDSDDDTIRDSDEGVADVDGDTIPNYRDLDSDGDYLQDYFEAGDADPGTGPYDHDGDSIADYLDIDTDGDTISDLHESNIDTGEDGSYDYLNEDSDGDTIPDRNEAGDYDVTTPPENCDDDTLPNYRDTDSDNDGIADADEASHGTDYCNADTDGDGVTDLVEVTYGSDPTNSDDSPLTHGDFVFEVPYEASPSPTVDTLVFSTDLQMADVYFLMDTTYSMVDEISNLQSSLSSTIIPGVQAVIPDVWFAVGRFDDYPVIPWGSPTATPPYTTEPDVVYRLNQRTTSSVAAAQNAVNSLVLHDGYDLPESHVPALWASATGNGLGTYLAAQGSCSASEVGYPCFRSGAVPIFVLITDAAFHNGPGGAEPYSGLSPTPPTYSQAVTQLNAINAKVIGIFSGTGTGWSHLTTLANDTGAVASGSPLVFDVGLSGTGLGTEVVDAIETLANQVPIRVDAIASDDPSDAVNAVTAFIDRIETNTSGSSVWDPATSSWRVCTTTSTSTPGTPPSTDYFSGVLPGQSVCFDIYPKMNNTVPATTDAQIFMAIIDVIGDLFTPLDSRDVYFLVPPVIPGGN